MNFLSEKPPKMIRKNVARLNLNFHLNLGLLLDDGKKVLDVYIKGKTDEAEQLN